MEKVVKLKNIQNSELIPLNLEIDRIRVYTSRVKTNDEGAFLTTILNRGKDFKTITLNNSKLERFSTHAILIINEI